MEEEESCLSKEFPQKLKKLRQNRGWSQGQLAKKVGADRNRVSRYERGVMWPTMELMVKIAQAFKVSVDYLIRDEQDIAINKMSNHALLTRLEALDQLSEEKQNALIILLDAVIKGHKFEELAIGFPAS